MIKNRYPFLLLLFVIVISACTKFQPGDEVFDVVVSSDCSAPCWREITPGTTSFDEAWEIAQNMALKDSATSDPVPDKIDKDILDRNFVIDFNKVGVLITPNSQGIINEIGFTFHRQYWDEPKLSDLIKVYGNPVSIDICYQEMEIRRVVVWIRYPNVYLMFSQKLPVEGDSFAVHVQKDTRIENITFTSPDVDVPIHDFAFPWMDYGDIIIAPAERNPLSTCPYP